MKILILKFSALGDVVRTSYILPGLCEKYDNPVIDWITSPAGQELLRHNPYIRLLASPQTGLEFLESNYYDLVLSFDDEEDVLKIVDKASHKKVVGAYLQDGRKYYSRDSSEWFDMGLISYDGKESADLKKKHNQREHNQIFADMLGIKIDQGIFYNSSWIKERIQKQFDKTVFNIGINSSACMRWKSKEMPFNEVCRLIERLHQYRVDNKKIKIHLLGGRSEETRNFEIREHVCKYDVKDWGGGNTLLEFAAIVKECDYVISSDSLALHLAISQKIYNLSFFAPTSASEIGTFETGIKVVSLSDDYCNYGPDSDNSTITADRIIDAFKTHCIALDIALSS